MLGLLCPECSIVKTPPPPPCIRSTRLYSCILQNNFKLLGIFATRKPFWVDIVSFSLVKSLYFYTVMSTFVLHTLMCLRSIGKPFTVENFIVEETEHSAWAMFRQHDSWIISNIIFEAHPES